MSWIVEKIEIRNFQGYRDIEVELSKFPNFFIGINGSGKTTLIEVLNSALTLDLDSLKQKKFSSCKITFRSSENNRKPILHIESGSLEGTSRRYMYGSIQESSSSSKIHFRGRVAASRALREKLEFEVFPDTNEADIHPVLVARRMLHDNLKVSWLSVHRGSAEIQEFDDFETNYINPIDQKLGMLQIAITRFFSGLDNRAARATQDYQHNFFLSLLARSTEAPKPLSKSHIDEEKETLHRIFTEFGLSEDVFLEKLNHHFETVETTSRKMLEISDDAAFTSTSGIDILSLFDTQRLHKLIEEWGRLEEDRAGIYEPKTKLKEILDSLFYRKKVTFTDRNLIKFESERGDEISLPQLSSGEKQILILLLEATLQENRSWVYLADEPELSLHVDWQERLVDHILALNHNAQIIFATHSPDIVSKYSVGIVKMEDL